MFNLTDIKLLADEDRFSILPVNNNVRPYNFRVTLQQN